MRRFSGILLLHGAVHKKTKYSFGNYTWYVSKIMQTPRIVSLYMSLAI